MNRPIHSPRDRLDQHTDWMATYIVLGVGLLLGVVSFALLLATVVLA